MVMSHHMKTACAVPELIASTRATEVRSNTIGVRLVQSNLSDATHQSSGNAGDGA